MGIKEFIFSLQPIIYQKKIQLYYQKKILIGLAAILVIIQFIRPKANDSNDQTNAIATKYKVPEEVAAILKVACNDCHTNKTEYPWYSKIQPIAWWLADHVEEGKHQLNLSTMAGIRVAFQNHKFEEIVEQMEKKEMPNGASSVATVCSVKRKVSFLGYGNR